MSVRERAAAALDDDSRLCSQLCAAGSRTVPVIVAGAHSGELAFPITTKNVR